MFGGNNNYYGHGIRWTLLGSFSALEEDNKGQVVINHQEKDTCESQSASLALYTDILFLCRQRAEKTENQTQTFFEEQSSR